MEVSELAFAGGLAATGCIFSIVHRFRRFIFWYKDRGHRVPLGIVNFCWAPYCAYFGAAVSRTAQVSMVSLGAK